MSRELNTTSRNHLRDGCGANTHFCFNPSVYSVGSAPNKSIMQAIIGLNVGFIRERWWPRNTAQQAAFSTLAASGVGFYLFIGDIGYTPAQARADVALLAESPIASSVIGVCGPNEPNSHGGTAWPSNVAAIQQAIHTEVFNQPTLADHVAVVGTALKHNVANIDADYQALAAAGIRRWCDVGDFHFYPGSAGPSLNAGEAKRAGQAYGPLPLWHSETGWTSDDTAPEVAGRFSVESLLRNHLTGIVGTILYEFADESQYVAGREGMFGMMKPVDYKPAYVRVRTLLATTDGNEAFDGRLAHFDKDVASDTGVVVTSEGNGRWTVYLMKETQDSVTLVLPPTLHADRGTRTTGNAGNNRYAITLFETLTVIQVTSN